MKSRSTPLVLILAIVLAPSACTGPPAPRQEAPAAIDAVSSPDWATDMRRFAAQDAAAPPPPHPIVFTGSSSIRLWEGLAGDFPGVAVLNRGFGGSQMRDAYHHASDIALRYRPRQIVLYFGDNDLSEGRTPQQVLHDFRAVVARFRHALPGVPIALISLKPSPARAHLLGAQRIANGLLRREAASMGGVDYIDIQAPMLDANGQPRAELFLGDGLHMNRAGYLLWRREIAPHLAR